MAGVIYHTNHHSAKIRLALYWILLFGGSPALASAHVPQAFLVQNSGWMEPFYADPNSQLKPLVTAIVEAATQPGETFYVAAFNQTTADNESPRQVYPNPENIPPRQAINGIELARKNKSGTLADTDFKEAVSKAILNQFQSQPGIIWIFTNNRNSPDNDQDTARRNAEFYQLLHNQRHINRTLVYPLAMPVRGKAYTAQGLMVYALAYGEPAEARLLELVADARLTQVLTAAPARLKPLDRESVRLTPKRILDSPKVNIRLADDQTTTILETEASEQQPGVTIQAEMENLFYPYRIESAQLSAQFLGENFQSTLQVTPETLGLLSPGAKQQVSVYFPIPLAQIPSVWSWTQLKRLGTQLSLPGRIRIELTQQRLALDPAFIQRLRSNFPNDPISDILTPPDEAQNSSVDIPLSIRVNYPVYPMVVYILSGLLLLAGLGWLLQRFTRPRPVVFRVDGAPRKLILKPWETLPIKSHTGEIIGEIKGGPLGPRVIRVALGHTIKPDS
jgi:hypothetical protein